MYYVRHTEIEQKLLCFVKLPLHPRGKISSNCLPVVTSWLDLLWKKPQNWKNSNVYWRGSHWRDFSFISCWRILPIAFMLLQHKSTEKKKRKKLTTLHCTLADTVRNCPKIEKSFCCLCFKKRLLVIFLFTPCCTLAVALDSLYPLTAQDRVSSKWEWWLKLWFQRQFPDSLEKW